MLVYSSMLHLMDQDPRADVRVALKTWLETKTGAQLSEDCLRQGKHALSATDLLRSARVRDRREQHQGTLATPVHLRRRAG